MAASQHRAVKAVKDPLNVPGPISAAYKNLIQIGEGTYGVVYRATRRADGVQLALKRVRLTVGEGPNETLASAGVSTTAVREMLLLRQLKHPHVVELIDVFFTSFPSIQLWLVFEFCALDLRLYIKMMSRAHKQVQEQQHINPPRINHHGIPWHQCRHFLRQLLLGLKFCHSLNILHRDIKPGNILISFPYPEHQATVLMDEASSQFAEALGSISQTARSVCEAWPSATVKIADLGLARNAQPLDEHHLTQEVITLWYRPPELLLGTATYSSAVDMWSVGCILAEMVAGRALFPGDSEIDTLFKIFRLLGTPTEALWSEGLRYPFFQTQFPKWIVANRTDSLIQAVFNNGPTDPRMLDLLEKSVAFFSSFHSHPVSLCMTPLCESAQLTRLDIPGLVNPDFLNAIFCEQLCHFFLTIKGMQVNDDDPAGTDLCRRANAGFGNVCRTDRGEFHAHQADSASGSLAPLELV